MGLTRAQVDKRQAFFESIERVRAQSRQVRTAEPYISTSVSSPKPFSRTIHQQTLPEN